MSEQQDDAQKAKRLLDAGWKQVTYFGTPSCWRSPRGMMIQKIEDAICNLDQEERLQREAGG